ncbi:uncharacterized protein K452DRAFT_305178 [Aplosporella prunicola CBS 121167]|uniref:Uncharacterized protein n=1 Tax=Aplosporella prunicola CBS 121167 TaxID=1176127 RepID=A0A6A6BQ00_9PEZI|nr:uncharacterized protein K452DRAFT_305178 [Aplosporella prunicola CBS 121167]KAF2146219.1 hypothetical protein K452DRAFT_305178 [Aplosporella prunicola CBS 121167]
MANMPTNRWWRPQHPFIQIKPTVNQLIRQRQNSWRPSEKILPKLLQGSAEHLDCIMLDLEWIRYDYIVRLSKNHTIPNTKDAVRDFVAECEKLLNHTDVVASPEVRAHMFGRIRSIAVDLMKLIQKKQAYAALCREKRYEDLVTWRAENPSGFKPHLPRWTQFLGHEAPGAQRLLLQYRNVLQPNRSTYQVIPHGGVMILMDWDNETVAIINDLDEKREGQPTLLQQRIEWGHTNVHSLRNGLRTFEPKIFEPSPWNKTSEDLLGYQDLESMDRSYAEMDERDRELPIEYLQFRCVLIQKFLKRRGPRG